MVDEPKLTPQEKRKATMARNAAARAERARIEAPERKRLTGVLSRLTAYLAAEGVRLVMQDYDGYDSYPSDLNLQSLSNPAILVDLEDIVERRGDG